jgi:hypothetical protein
VISHYDVSHEVKYLLWLALHFSVKYSGYSDDDIVTLWWSLR